MTAKRLIQWNVNCPISHVLSELNGTRSGAHAAWGMSYPYWFSEDRWPARAILLTVILLNLGMVGISVLLNQWNAKFYDSLQYKNYRIFIELLIRFCWLADFYIVCAVYALY
jgi:vitamin B12/bleomycin/antimicrobial peptide transport system ATP-binding/permease protein